MNKDIRTLIRSLAAQGFTVEQSRGNHYTVRNAEGRRVATLAGSASDTRSMKNSLADLKRAGYDPTKKK